ncbi:hypothetical protein MTO96_020687 [Rhipicephalus appendiculatus]
MRHVRGSTGERRVVASIGARLEQTRAAAAGESERRCGLRRRYRLCRYATSSPERRGFLSAAAESAGEPARRAVEEETRAGERVRPAKNIETGNIESIEKSKTARRAHARCFMLRSPDGARGK